jgi:PPOX class probable F420-dependent enzyme
VPITFAMVKPDTLVTAVDHKPKTTRRLRRLANIERDPRVTVLADRYDDADWTALWWVRARGRARIVDDGDDLVAAVDALVGRYQQYAEHRPGGPVIVVHVTGWKGWAAGGVSAAI